MAWIAAINFRATAGYVTDGASETYCLGNADTYPTTRGGLTFGWDGVIGDMGRDRDSALDRRLAGMNQAANDGASQTVFRLDLISAGNYKIRLALGDGTSPQNYQYVKIADNTTPVLTIANASGTAAAHFLDAANADYAAAAWPGSNAFVTGVAFGSTILKLTLGSPTVQSNSSTIAHLYVEQETVGSTFAFGQMTSIASRSRVITY